MNGKLRVLQAIVLTILLLAMVLPAAADRPGWNESPRAPGYDGNGLLRINTDYFTLAAATGGDFYFWAPGEFAASAALLSVPIASDPIALSYGSGRDFVRAMEVPVDAAITGLSLFAGAQRLDGLEMLRPDGRSVEENPAGVAVQTYRHMRIITVEDPEPGRWRVEARGSGTYCLSARYLAERAKLVARGLEAIDLIGLAFVEPRGRPGHEGLFPVAKPVRVGEERLCRFTLSGGVGQPEVEMISEEGELLGKIRLEATVGTTGDEFVGRCRIPARPFRVRVRGKDREGHPFQRLSAALTSPDGAQ